METFGPYLNAIHPLETEVLAEYVAQWQPCSFPRKTLITPQGKVQRDLFFVLEGIQKSYLQVEGKEHVIAFTYAPSFTGIPESFLLQEPSSYFLATITPSRMLRLSHDRLQALMARYRSVETLHRKFTEQVLLGFMQRYYEWMSLDMEARFKAFVKRSPHLLNQVPHKDLASYLRIDPSNFSKLLNQVKI